MSLGYTSQYNDGFRFGCYKGAGKRNFTEACAATAKLVPTHTKISLQRKVRPHLVRELVQKSRQILLNLGFEEVENPTILPDGNYGNLRDARSLGETAQEYSIPYILDGAHAGDRS